MRIKLSYTVEEEDVLKETIKIMNLSAEDVQGCVKLFKLVQDELGNDRDETPNVQKVLEMLKDFRESLFAIDTRLAEVTELVLGYDDFQRNKYNSLISSTPASSSEEVMEETQ